MTAESAAQGGRLWALLGKSGSVGTALCLLASWLEDYATRLGRGVAGSGEAADLLAAGSTLSEHMRKEPTGRDHALSRYVADLALTASKQAYRAYGGAAKAEKSGLERAKNALEKLQALLGPPKDQVADAANRSPILAPTTICLPGQALEVGLLVAWRRGVSLEPGRELPLNWQARQQVERAEALVMILLRHNPEAKRRLELSPLQLAITPEDCPMGVGGPSVGLPHFVVSLSVAADVPLQPTLPPRLAGGADPRPLLGLALTGALGDVAAGFRPGVGLGRKAAEILAAVVIEEVGEVPVKAGAVIESGSWVGGVGVQADAAGSAREGLRRSADLLKTALGEVPLPEVVGLRNLWDAVELAFGANLDLLLSRLAPGGACLHPVEDRIHPAAKDLLVGRAAELQRLHDALLDESPRPCAVVGMPGVGKTYLVDAFWAVWHAHFGGLIPLVLELDPKEDLSPDTQLQRLASLSEVQPVGDGWVGRLRQRLLDRRVLVRLENVDGRAAAALAAQVASRLPGVRLVLTGRSLDLGTEPRSRWVRIELPELSTSAALELLHAELSPCPPPEADLLRLAGALGNLPLALHNAAGYLRRTYNVDSYLRLLRRSGWDLEPPDPGDHAFTTDRRRAVVAKSFALSLDLLREELGERARTPYAAFLALGHAPLAGFGLSLGAAIARVDEDVCRELLGVAYELALVRRLDRSTAFGEGPAVDLAFQLHPVLAELLQACTSREQPLERASAWFRARLWPFRPVAPGRTALFDTVHGAPILEFEDGRWSSTWVQRLLKRRVAEQVMPSIPAYWGMRGPGCDEVDAEKGALGWWLRSLTGDHLFEVLVEAGPYAVRSHASSQEWLRAARALARNPAFPAENRRVLEHFLIPVIARTAAGAASELETKELVQLYQEDILPALDGSDSALDRARMRLELADALEARGEHAAALEARSSALRDSDRAGEAGAHLTLVLRREIARSYLTSGNLPEAERLLREALELIERRIAHIRSTIDREALSACYQVAAQTTSELADVLHARGDHEQARRLYEQSRAAGCFWDWRGSAFRVADLLERAGQLVPALKTLRARNLESLSLTAALDSLRAEARLASRLNHRIDAAMTWSRVADRLEAAGRLDEAIEVRRMHEHPALSKIPWCVNTARWKLANALWRRGRADDKTAARRLVGIEDDDDWQFGLPIDVDLANGDYLRTPPSGLERDYLAALKAYQEYLQVLEGVGHERARAHTLVHLADVHVGAGLVTEATRLWRDQVQAALEQAADFAGSWWASNLRALESIDAALASRHRGDLATEARLLVEALAALDELPAAKIVASDALTRLVRTLEDPPDAASGPSESGWETTLLCWLRGPEADRASAARLVLLAEVRVARLEVAEALEVWRDRLAPVLRALTTAGPEDDVDAWHRIGLEALEGFAAALALHADGQPVCAAGVLADDVLPRLSAAGLPLAAGAARRALDGVGVAILSACAWAAPLGDDVQQLLPFLRAVAGSESGNRERLVAMVRLVEVRLVLDQPDEALRIWSGPDHLRSLLHEVCIPGFDGGIEAWHAGGLRALEDLRAALRCLEAQDDLGQTAAALDRVQPALATAGMYTACSLAARLAEACRSGTLGRGLPARSPAGWSSRS